MSASISAWRTAGRRAVAALATITLAAVGAVAVGSIPAAAATSTLVPGSMSTTAGTTGSGQAVSNLVVKDQSGTQDTWSKYVEFTGVYAGFRTYALPASVSPANVTGIQVSANYRGPAPAQQTWTWSLWNWGTSTWTSVGTNAGAPSWGSWKLLGFASPGAASAHVNGSGSIRVQLKANNASDAANIDFESVVVTSNDAADTTPPSTPASLAVSGAPTSTSVALTWGAASDNVGVSGYEVFQNGGTTPVATSTGTSATVTGLTASTTYSFTVKARDAAGNRSSASSAASATTAAAGGGSLTLPPANGKYDYQLGGAYTPAADVQVVSRDRTVGPAAGKYNICYVNLLQTQPDEPGQSTTNPPYGTTQWWRNNHNNLLLKNSSGQVIIDQDWNEALFDVRTAANRTALLNIQKAWFDGCKTSGYQAIEPDNLDAFERSLSLITFPQTKEYLKLVVPYVHSIGLAIAQKNTKDSPNGYGTTGKTFVNTVSPAQGFDFAIAEECAAYEECDGYTAVYGSLVFVIEYTDNNPPITRGTTTKTAYQWACQDFGATLSIMLRDRNVTPAGDPAYFYQTC